MRNQSVAKVEVCGDHGFNADVSKSRTEEELGLCVAATGI